MNERVVVIVTALITAVLALVHLTDDVVHGFEPGGTSNLTGVLILVVWIAFVLTFTGQRWQYVVLLLLSVAGVGVSRIHMLGPGMVGGRMTNSPDLFRWVLTLMAMGVTSGITGIFAVLGLWRSFRPAPASASLSPS